jgi:hypothetical protein
MIYAMIVEKFFIGEVLFFVLGLWATWMTGKATASTWGGIGTLLFYCLFLAAGMRFLHFALYEGPFLSLTHYISDLIIIAIVAFISYRYTRTNQMVGQYGWLVERASPLSWRNRG